MTLTGDCLSATCGNFPERNRARASFLVVGLDKHFAVGDGLARASPLFVKGLR